MSQILPPLLIALAATALLATLVSLWSSVRALLAATGGVQVRSRTLPERERLLAEKKALLTAIKDLEFERDVGKLSDEDYARLDERYRGAARDALRALEAQVGPHRERARGMIEAHVGAGAGAGANTGKGPHAVASTPAPAPVAADGVVHGCGARNDVDAVFCKKCGERLGGEAAS